MTSLLGQAAENYARSGWYIFPVKPRDKVPMTTHGLKNATTDLDTIRRWWAKTPDANIGLNCGLSQIVVVDLDRKPDHDGMAEWSELTSSLHIHPETATSQTGGGGRHLLFKAPTDVTVRNSAGKIAPAIDVRGDGGYIVLPPSIHPTTGQPYQWFGDVSKLEPLPQAVLDILTTEPDPWAIYTLADAFAPRPPLVWVVDEVIPAGSLNIWYGAPGTLKSMILADMAVCVAAGQRWLTPPVGRAGAGFGTAAGSVLWLDFDNGLRRTHERFAALGRARNLPASVPLYYVSMPDPFLDAGDTAAVGALANRIALRDVRLVIIDNLGVVSGESDENSAEMQRPMAGLRWVAEVTGAAVVVLHHQRKSNGFNTRAGEGLRGHGSIEAKIDSAMLVTRDGPTVTVTPTKTRGSEIKPFAASFAFENDGAHELTQARFWPAMLNEEEIKEQARLEADIVEFLTKTPGATATKVYDYVGGNKKNVFDTLRRMELDKKLSKLKGPGMSLFLYVA